MTPMAQALSTALLHFIWQGIAGQILLGIALLSLRKSSANSRYLASCIVLAALAAAPLVTVWAAYPVAPVSAEIAVGATDAASKAHVVSASQGPAAKQSIGSIEQWILPIWAVGVFVFALRLAWAAGHASSLRRRGIEADSSIESLVMGLADRLGIRRKLRVLVSSLADVPSVVGWIRPIILLPASVVVGLTPQQLEALLAHELAHIRRHDYVVNILQMVVETLLFYHPSVWWISSRIRHERELCCDDVAVGSCGNAVIYARALAQLERLRPIAPSLAVGSADGPLYGRIQRLLGSSRNEHGPSRLASAAGLLIGVLCLGLVISTARAQQETPIRTEVREAVQVAPIMPTPTVAPAPPVAPARVAPTPLTSAPPEPQLAPVAPQAASPAAPASLTPPSPAPAAVAPVLAVPASPLQPVSPLQVAPAAPVAAPAPPSPLLVLPLLQSITQGEGVRWVLFSGNDVIVRGLNTDEEQARKAREGFTGDLLWFRLDGKSYVTQDRETMDQMVFGVSPASQRARDAETAERMRQQAAAQQAAAQQEAALASAAEQRKALQDVQAMARQIDEQIRNAAPPPSQNLVELQRAATELQAATVRLQAHLASREANLRQAEAQLQMMQAMNQNLQRNSAVINRLNEAVNSRNEGLLREAVRTGKAQVVP